MNIRLVAAACLVLFASGCACQSASPDGAAVTMPPTADVPAVTHTVSAESEILFSGRYTISGAEETLSGGSYDSLAPGEAAILLVSGRLDGTELHIDKTGDLEEAESPGQNAAVIVADGSALRLQQVLLTTNGRGAIGVFCTGDLSDAALTGGMIATSGTGSAAVAAANGASLSLDDLQLLTDSTDSPCLLLSSGAQATATGLTVRAVESYALELADGSAVWNGGTLDGGICLSGTASLAAEAGRLQSSGEHALFTVQDGAPSVSLTGVLLVLPKSGRLLHLRSGTLTLSGDHQAFSGELVCEQGSALRLRLSNNSTFTGRLSNENYMDITLALDATSRWFVTGDSYLEALEEGEGVLQNIESNGFNVYYNSENEANAWLNSQPYALPGGGYLSPLI